MVKLIRLQGDSDVNNEEIRNKFRQPIILKPNAKVALLGASALLNDRIVNESFVIGNTNKFLKIGVQPNNYTTGPLLQYNAEIANGNYGIYEFTEELGTALNYSCTDSCGSYCQFQTSVAEGVLNVTAHRTNPEQPKFNDTSFWSFYDGSASSISEIGLTAGAAGASLSTAARKNCSIPVFHNFFRFTAVDASAGMVLNASAFDDVLLPVSHIFGVRIDASGNYYARWHNETTPLSPNEASFGSAWAANDVVRMWTRSGYLTITVHSSSNVLKGTYSQPNRVPRAFYKPNGDKFDWDLDLPAGTSITSCLFTILINIPDSAQNLQDVEGRFSLQFVTPTGSPNNLLATYCGFALIGTSQIPFNGNPAVIKGRDQMLGVAVYPSILVAVDGLGPLQSYDGSSDSKSQDNIVYCINDLTVIKSNQLQLDVPNYFSLNINNNAAINVSELRARFLPSAGSASNRALTFSGKPSLSLLIED